MLRRAALPKKLESKRSELFVLYESVVMIHRTKIRF